MIKITKINCDILVRGLIYILIACKLNLKNNIYHTVPKICIITMNVGA